MSKQEPLFWYRPCSDGLYEGPLHNAQIERVRKDSGAWVPLFTEAQASALAAVPTDVLAGLRMLAIVALGHIDLHEDEPHPGWSEWAHAIEPMVPGELDTESELLAETMAWLLAAAPLPAPAAQQVPAVPAAWRHNLTHDLYETEDQVQLADAESWAEPLYTADQVRAMLAAAPLTAPTAQEPAR